MQHRMFFGHKDIAKLGEGGSYYEANFIDAKQAAKDFLLLQEQVNWHDVAARGNVMKRKKAAFVELAPDGRYPLYRYPFMFHEVETKLHPVVRSYLEKCQARSLEQSRLNHAIATFYKDGNVTIGEHHDNPRDISPGSYIYDVSLGAARWFRLTSNDGKRVQEILLQPGSLLVLDWATNAAWTHSVPKHVEQSEPRISIVYRSIRTMSEPRTTAV